jgi:hypothetical protein
MKRLVLVIITVMALLIPAASASARGWGGHRDQPAPQAASLSSAEVTWYSTGLSRIAVAGSESSSFGRWFINRTIVKIMPVVCPILAGQADPNFEAFILAFCDQLVLSDDPLGDILEFAPLLCGGDPPLGSIVFPRYARLLDLLCVFIA